MNSDTGNNCVAYLVSFGPLAAAGGFDVIYQENRSQRSCV